MKTKTFDLEAAKNGAKIVTRDGRSARIVGWDAKGEQPIIALVSNKEKEVAMQYGVNGRYHYDMELDFDLFLADETPELTEFEQAILDNVFTESSDTTVFASKKLAKKLLSIARKELQKEQKNVDTQDLPHWKRMIGACGSGDDFVKPFLIRYGKGVYAQTNCVGPNDVYIDLEELEKLPMPIDIIENNLSITQKEQKSAEKQDYSGLNDLENAILRGFLAAGMENVSRAIIEETAQDVLAHTNPAEWSKEDERIRKELIALFSDCINNVNHPYSSSDSERWLAYLEKQKPIEWSDSVAKGMFIKALERAVEQTKKGYELTDCDKHSWWEDFKAYCEIKLAEWSEEDKRAIDRACVALRAYSKGDIPEILPSELLGYADRLQSLLPPHPVLIVSPARSRWMRLKF